MTAEIETVEVTLPFEEVRKGDLLVALDGYVMDEPTLVEGKDDRGLILPSLGGGIVRRAYRDNYLRYTVRRQCVVLSEREFALAGDAMRTLLERLESEAGPLPELRELLQKWFTFARPDVGTEVILQPVKRG